MTAIVLLFGLPPALSQRYHEGISAAFPDVDVALVTHVSQIDPYLADMDVLVTHGPYLADRADHVLSQARKLKWIQGIGTGVDNFADRPTLRDDITISNIHGVHGNPMSEAAFAAMLALSRRVPRSVRNQDQQRWESWPSRLITGKTIGIFGVGSIALTVAPRCKAFDMTVVGISSGVRPVAGFDRMVHRDSLVEAVRDLDYLLLLTPYSPQTHHIVGQKVFDAMKPQAFLINHARGGVVDEVALLRALQGGHIAGAALDVFATEPLPKGHPFWTMENVLITCHQSATHEGTIEANLPIILHNIREFLAGNPAAMRNVVRPARTDK
ncbi:MAG: D-2-hydroxyacid dehydrogenase [Hyphomicrobiales bacterium]|nr:D-2-hydroxyacid dehydrogenase [Hyphomicrobiales bacterium]